MKSSHKANCYECDKKISKGEIAILRWRKDKFIVLCEIHSGIIIPRLGGN